MDAGLYARLPRPQGLQETPGAEVSKIAQFTLSLEPKKSALNTLNLSSIWPKLIACALCQQSISPGCPAQPAQVPAAPHLALVEDVAEGQAHAQRYPR